MKILIAIFLFFFLIESASAKDTLKVGEKNYSGTSFYGFCIDGVEYLARGHAVFPRLKPDVKLVTCNY